MSLSRVAIFDLEHDVEAIHGQQHLEIFPETWVMPLKLQFSYSEI